MIIFSSQVIEQEGEELKPITGGRLSMAHFFIKCFKAYMRTQSFRDSKWVPVTASHLQQWAFRAIGTQAGNSRPAASWTLPHSGGATAVAYAALGA